MNTKYELGFANKGNGTTVYNRLKEVHGDYENIAHISDLGKISHFQKDLPTDVQKVIEGFRDAQEFIYRNLKVRKNQFSETQGTFHVLNEQRESVVSFSMQLPNPINRLLMNDEQIKSYLDMYFFANR